MKRTRVVVPWLVPLFLHAVTAWTTTSRTTRTTTRLFQAPSQQTATTSSKPRSVLNLETWAATVGIQTSAALQLSQDKQSGYGWTATLDVAANAVLLQVPTAVALTVDGQGPSDARVLRRCIDRVSFRRELPWYAQFSAYLYVLRHDDKDDDDHSNSNIQPWLDSLPRRLDTPLHWTAAEVDALQYDFMTQAVAKQRDTWQGYHQALTANGFPELTYDEFVWGCDIARSRAFSGAYAGGAFNPAVYAFTAVLVAVYVGLGLGTVQQAANGAAVVVCATVLKDFVWPKLFNKSKKYAICPLIDMANHQSVGYVGDVSFEYFANAYSLATNTAVPAGHAVCISYGARSTDQWLQYYGFVEADNPHDVYILPPLRQWPIADMEAAAGRTVAAGRLQALERAGLLGYTGGGSETEAKQAFDENAANADGGVVVSRMAGLDPAVWQALRALFCTDAEWTACGESVGSFAISSPSTATETAVRQAATCALEWELNRKATTLEQDVALQQRQSNSKAVDASTAEALALAFRIEKKKLLQECLRMF